MTKHIALKPHILVFLREKHHHHHHGRCRHVFRYIRHDASSHDVLPPHGLHKTRQEISQVLCMWHGESHDMGDSVCLGVSRVGNSDRQSSLDHRIICLIWVEWSWIDRTHDKICVVLCATWNVYESNNFFENTLHNQIRFFIVTKIKDMAYCRFCFRINNQ